MVPHSDSPHMCRNVTSSLVDNALEASVAAGTAVAVVAFLDLAVAAGIVATRAVRSCSTGRAAVGGVGWVIAMGSLVRDENIFGRFFFHYLALSGAAFERDLSVSYGFLSPALWVDIHHNPLRQSHFQGLFIGCTLR